MSFGIIKHVKKIFLMSGAQLMLHSELVGSHNYI